MQIKRNIKRTPNCEKQNLEQNIYKEEGAILVQSSILYKKEHFKYETLISKWTKIIALFESLVFLLLGIYFLFFQKNFNSVMGITFNNVNGLADYKAIYGGLHLGIGVFMIINLLRRDYLVVIFLMFTTACGLALARSVSVIQDYAPTTLMLFLLGVEILTILINGLLLILIKSIELRSGIISGEK